MKLRHSKLIQSLAFFLAALPLASMATAAEKPNIVLILSDDQSWTDYGFMGHDTIRTPNLDRLAKESVLYPRGYVPTPLCRPSLMNLVTGHYTRDHGVTGNDPSPQIMDQKAPEYVGLAKELITNIDRFDTLPEILVRNGYLAHQSGKWWEGNHTRGGFTHGMTEGSPGRGARHGDEGLKIGREGLKPIYDFIEEAENQDKPFYLWYAPFLPHTPHNPPQRILDHYAKMDLDPKVAKYYAMCEWFDETCGELIGHLEKKGLRENTLIYYVCDNGWIQRSANTKVPDEWFTSFAPRSKQSPYEGGTRNPIMFSWPGMIEPDRRGDLVSSLDTFPTILSAAGIEVPDGLPGMDLWSSIQTGESIRRNIIFGDLYAHDIADLENPEASLMYLWCIQDRWKLILTYDGEVNRYAVTHPRTEPIQLFDVISDPYETKNLADQYPQVVTRLKEEIEKWYPLKQRKLVSVE
jgi:uncharacterized sulfatase